MRHDAIYRAYPNAVTIDGGVDVWDKDGNKIIIDNELVEQNAKIIDEEIKAKKELVESKLLALGLSIEDLKIFL